MRVKVIDRNDSPPVFRDINQIVSVSEDLQIGQSITTLTATDLDTLGIITYSLMSGDDGKFALESSRGILTLRDSLDRESNSEYKLVVRADDGEQFSETTIIIKVRHWGVLISFNLFQATQDGLEAFRPVCFLCFLIVFDALSQDFFLYTKSCFENSPSLSILQRNWVT